MGNIDRVRETIRQQGRLARWVALQMGISESYLSKLLDGRRVWTPDLRRRVAEVLGVSESSLFLDAECRRTDDKHISSDDCEGDDSDAA